ncbi:3-deoxy-D-manno-octulosonate 8-phosphate phosphatase (KDO 8-P phosphatase) [Candidatus Magnetomoraceae bacterium gMMP-15]
MNKKILEKTKEIKALLFDIDGVFTDGSIIYDNNGNEIKRFNVKDGLIVFILKRMGFKVGAITGRSSKVVELRCNELNLDFYRHGARKKLQDYDEFKKLFELEDKHIAYIGDDLIDLPILERCGLAVCPRDAREYIKDRVDFVTNTKGGEGVVRDVADFILKTQGLLDKLIEMYIDGSWPEAWDSSKYVI